MIFPFKKKRAQKKSEGSPGQGKIVQPSNGTNPSPTLFLKGENKKGGEIGPEGGRK